ncbi:PREDICTED: ubiquitin-like modifier-activating enzyme atg7 isoform X1 [Polistes dominula]|uniref:Ubiquitin-like modifier-activating enzyme ATG7 n=1 Tax=Polistes dominula TaxID=743375 RepID=A0ABM1I9J5_POLDO|nr:PREDICTED: ubiquitin-like modifier-activating enzyme atg7 isoform X1 [Polistes dominula]XP_015176883.1 PREDICTED: ubiquitin-like modifier-activating enzyme atg7 isoform X1 [Polistes dominula]
MMSINVVKFTKLRTSTNSTFWAKFSELKIDKLRLDEKSHIKLWGSYSLDVPDRENNNPLLLDYTSFNENIESNSINKSVISYGYMVNTNTYEAFRKIDPQSFIDSMGKCIIDDITSGEALTEPWKLSIFLLFSYADLKSYKFHYWIAHPTPLSLPEMYHEKIPKSINDIFSENQLDKLYESFQQLDYKQKPFFSVFLFNKKNIEVNTLSKGITYINACENKVGIDCEIFFAFYDPCKSLEPGWQLRNLLCLLFWHCPTHSFTKSIQILSLRKNDFRTAVVYTLKCKEYADQEKVKKSISGSHLVGWEQNENGKMGPRIIDLSESLNPIKLAENAINLNLKLMKWRLVPDLDLEKISNLKCLLLGAGTLGCAVARVLIGWGITNITFVDKSTVSHSNTVRQSLYTHEDAVQRKFKVDAAKDALLKILPTMNVHSINLQIPMPGHVVGQSMLNATKEAVEKLENAIAGNDVVFLLLDSREARWLPTLLCAVMKKITINAALGFDTYMVQRHGIRNLTDSPVSDITTLNPDGKDLGCYFCNDVTQPGNSQTDRTLDLQCTVSRPGLSQIAAGLAVELMVAITQHPQGLEARALVTENKNNVNSNFNGNTLEGLLGAIPHTIRGSIWSFESFLTVTHRFSSCAACSLPLMLEYKKRGFQFILDACNIPNYLEKLCGLEELLNDSDLDKLCNFLDDSSEDEEQFRLMSI